MAVTKVTSIILVRHIDGLLLNDHWINETTALNEPILKLVKYENLLCSKLIIVKRLF